jgi:hypothetical protein
MKKILLFIPIAILSFAYGFSQISFGPVAGICMSKAKVDEVFVVDGQEVSVNNEASTFGFKVGAFARFQISSVYLQPSLLFTHSGGKISIENQDFGEDIRTLRYNKLDLPVLIGRDVFKFLRLQAGPVFSLILSDDARDVDVAAQVDNNYNNAVIGFQVGGGFDLGDKIYVDIKYEGNLSSLGESITISGSEFDTDLRNPMWVVTVGYNLF